MKKLFLLFGIIGFIIILTGISGCTENRNEYISVDKFDHERNAAKDIELAVAEAKRTGRNIILDVGGEWCIWCHRLDEFIEANEELSNYIAEKYIVVKINYSPENKNEEVLSKFPHVAGYPHLFVLDTNGKLIHSQNTGDFEVDKSYSVNKIYSFLEKWAPSDS